MNELHELAIRTILGNTLQSWAIALGVFALLFTILPLLRAALGNRLKKLPPHRALEPANELGSKAVTARRSSGSRPGDREPLGRESKC